MTFRQRFQIPIALRIAARGGLWLIALCLGTGIVLAQTPAPTTTEQARASLEAGMEARLDAAERELANDPRFKEHTKQQRRDAIEFVVGNVIFAVVHEVGHMLVSELTLPVLGHEEDAVDAFAVLSGLKLGDAFSDRVLSEAARGWFLSDLRDKKENVTTVYYDEHGLDEQRGYSIVCLMVGSHPQKFVGLAEKTKLPEERQKSCQHDYSRASSSWDQVLTPHIRRPDQPKSPITATYADIPQYAFLKRSLSQMRLLETLAEHLSDRYVWREPVALEMTTCSQPGAFWDVSIRKIMVCYELATDYADLHRGYAEHEVAAPSRRIARSAAYRHPRHRPR